MYNGFTVKAKSRAALLDDPVVGLQESITVAVNASPPSSAPARKSSLSLFFKALNKAGPKKINAEVNRTKEVRLTGNEGAASATSPLATLLDPYKAAKTFKRIKLPILLFSFFFVHAFRNVVPSLLWTLSLGDG